MPRYFKFEKKTSRGTLGHDLAVEGNVFYQRMRRGENVKTGRVGGRASSIGTYPTEAAAQAAFEKRLQEIQNERFVQVGGPALPDGLALPPKTRKKTSGFTVKGKPLPASAKEIAAFEAKLRVHLPPSYRHFVTTYGAGELLGFVRIFAPRGKGKYRLASLVRDAVDVDLLCFADTGGGDLFGWVPAKDAKTEPAVLFLQHGRDRAKKVASDFEAFVRGLTTSQRFVEKLFVDLDAEATFVCR